MKRAASLNYLNQPSAAPLQVRAVLIQCTVGEKERTTPVEEGRVTWDEDSVRELEVGR